MKTLTKAMAGILVTGALLAGGTASAAVLCNTLSTTNDWQTAGSCEDDDNDVLFTFGAYIGNFPGTTGFETTEVTIAGVDHYDIGFDWHGASFPNGYAGGGGIRFTISSLSNELFNSAGFDTDVVSSTTATKELFDTFPGSPFLTLASINGTHDPAVGGETPFSGRTIITMVDTFADTGGNGVFLHADNSFTAAVPEPVSLALLGLGLAALGFSRRGRVS